MALRMPGAVLMSRLKVYDTPASDGQIGGTPHVHLVCSEMYTVLSGSGAVEIINWGGFSRVPLQSNDTLLFTPGTLHRLINPNGDLTILVMMQNSGLPERGDNVVTFPFSTLQEQTTYQDAMQIESLADAYRRRDLGVAGFLQLKAAFETSLDAGREALQIFYQLAAARTVAHRVAWRQQVMDGALDAAQRTLQQLEALSHGQTDYLQASAHALIQPPEKPVNGFCGQLQRYFDPASLSPEGVVIP